MASVMGHLAGVIVWRCQLSRRGGSWEGRGGPDRRPLTSQPAAPILPAEPRGGESPPRAGCFMPVIVVVGGQWGDEGKGRIVDLLAQKAHVVARYSAGANAGHTVVNEAGEFAL